MPDGARPPRLVVDGVEPVASRGLAGVREKVDRDLAAPYLALLGTIMGLIVLAGVTGAQSAVDTVVFVLLAGAVGAVVIVLPALVARLGEPPERRRRGRARPLDIVSLAISSERITVARSTVSGLDVDDRLRPRLREDVGVLLAARLGLHLDDPDDADAIRAVIGEPAWELIRPDRPAREAWQSMRRTELEAVIGGCLAAVDGTTARSTT